MNIEFILFSNTQPLLGSFCLKSFQNLKSFGPLAFSLVITNFWIHCTSTQKMVFAKLFQRL